MGNPSSPYGFRPVRTRSGAPWVSQISYYFITGDNQQIMPGDPVVLAGSANTAEVTALGLGTFGAGQLPTVVRAIAGAGNAITGICVGVMPVTDDSLRYRVNNTDRVLAVLTDEDVIYRARLDGVAAVTDVGQNCNVVFTQSGNESFATSGAQASATFAAAANSQLKFLGAINEVDSTFGATGNEGLFLVNQPNLVHDKAGV